MAIKRARPIYARKSDRFKSCLAWLGILIVYVVARVNFIDVPLDRDEGVFGYMGQLIVSGGMPYADAYDHKPPGVFYINALALLLVPPTASGIHFFLQVYNFLTLICLYFVAKIYFQSGSTGRWTALCYAVFSSSPTIQGFTASTEMFMLLPIALSLLFAVMTIRQRKPYLCLLSGITGASACWIKPTAFFSILFVFGYLALAEASVWRKENQPASYMVKSILLWSAGALGLSLMIGLYYHYHGIFDQFIYWSFTHSFHYVQSASFSDKLLVVLDRLVDITEGNFIIIGSGTVFAVVGLFKRQRRCYFVVGFLLLSVLGTVPGHAYKHYFAQLAPAVAVAAGFAVSFMLRTMPRGVSQFTVAAVCAVSIVLVPLISYAEFYLERSENRIIRTQFGYNPFPEAETVADFIARHTDPEDSVFVLGSEPQIYFLAQRKSATSHVMMYPLGPSYRRSAEFQKEAWEQLHTNKPKYIVLVDVPTSIPWFRNKSAAIYQNTRGLLAKEYYLDGLMLIGGERGEFFKLSELLDRQVNGMTRDRYAIYVFRKNV